MRYKQNLRIDGSKVYSYNTHVATISGDKLLVHGWWSQTTSKHINHVADTYGLEKVEAPRGEKPETDNGASLLKSVAMVAKFGEILAGPSLKEKNDWKARMLKAGLGNQGLYMPENWDQLSEDEKAKRLNSAVEAIA